MKKLFPRAGQLPYQQKVSRRMSLTQPYGEIYEQDSIYGDEEKFGKNSNRFEKMISVVKKMRPRPQRVLDIGCGTGYFANTVSLLFPQSTVYGVDISQKALQIAKKKYKNVHFKYADAEKKLPFQKDSFDLIISGEHIEHLVDTDTYLSEIYRVCKKEGILLLTTPNLASWLNRVLLLIGKQPFKTEASLRKTLPIVSVFNYTIPEDLSSPAVGHLRVMTFNMLKKLLSFYGFKTVESFGRTMLTKPVLRQIDEIFSQNPEFASGVVVKLKKI